MAFLSERLPRTRCGLDTGSRQENASNNHLKLSSGSNSIILEYTAGHTLMVELTYLPPAAHRTQLRRVSPRTIQEDHLLAFCHLHQEEMAFRLTRIQGVKLLNERGWTPANHSQAG